MSCTMTKRLTMRSQIPAAWLSIACLIVLGISASSSVDAVTIGNIGGNSRNNRNRNNIAVDEHSLSDTENSNLDTLSSATILPTANSISTLTTITTTTTANTKYFATNTAFSTGNSNKSSGNSSSNRTNSTGNEGGNGNVSLLGKLSLLPNTRIKQCREGCLEKFAIKESVCQQRPECSLNGFPSYSYNSLPDVLHLLCWDECAKPPPPKINKSILETWALAAVSMLQQNTLVLVNIAWAPFNAPNQCLVTWEVSGGGLLGNLLTESSSVQLSLWPDTKYRVQVTCKNKKTQTMSRSLPLTIDTSEAIPAPDRKQQTSLLSPVSPPSSTVEGATMLSGNGNQAPPAEDDIPDEISNFILDWQNSSNDMQKPLLFGVVAGSILLAVVLCMYVCLLRNQHNSSDKEALIEKDNNHASFTAGHTLPSSMDTIGPMGCTPIDDAAIYAKSMHVLNV